MRAAQPDYVFVVGWSQIVNAEFLNIAARGSIGYHPAPLPRLRGGRRSPGPFSWMSPFPPPACSG
ncbi:formyltransferase family protein [Novosphingobium panipatense]